MTRISLFPIPNLVVFPGNSVPLHVFEPRYRAMVHDSIDEERMIGVAHTRKTIHEGPSNSSIEEVLTRNQATYQPFEIFSAGPCEIVKQLDDGRIHVMIRAEGRYRIESDVQMLPYRIVEASPVHDEEDDDRELACHLKERVNDRLIRILRSRDRQLIDILESDAWFNQPPADYSFRLFQVLNFDADIMQQILETRRASERLRLIDGMLSQVSR